MPYSQKERMCRVVSPLGDDALLVERMYAREAISELFLLELELLSERDDIAFDEIVGKSLTVTIDMQNGKQRHWNGVVSRFSIGPTRGRFASYRAEVVPGLWVLTRRSGCRIYQHLSVPDIAKKLFGELGVSEVRFELQRSYPEREYCVQYRESDFNFVSRLFEDVGISYYFEHGEKANTLVVFDSPGANPACPNQATAIYASASGAGGTSGEVDEWLHRRDLRAGAWAAIDYNFEQPSLSLLSSAPTSHAIANNAKLEIYDHPGDFLQPGHGESFVKTRIEAEESASFEARGTSICPSFTPGFRFDLRGHFRKDANDTYVLTSVQHRVVDAIGDHAVTHYENAFTCRPHKIPYRPLCTTPRPLIHGVQTATVVGAAGQEIDVDAHARVVVQFHWDREGKRDANSSCRVRVAQNWAGKGWGLIAHPRIGQEVVIDFLEGNPDKPIVIGRVYNGEQTPPYGLPANHTQTGIKSRSSPGGGGFNEIRLEDKAGSELMYVQAQKDRTTLTKNDDSQTVGHDRTRAVTNDEKVSVGANQTIAVTADRTRTVGGSESVTVGASRTKNITADETVGIGGAYSQTVGGSRTRTVSGAETVTVALARTHSVGINEAITVGAAQEVTVGAARTLTVAGAQTTSIGAAHTVTVAAGQNVTIGAGHDVKVGADEAIAVSGKQGVNVASDRSLSVGGNLTETVSKDYTHTSGKKVKIEGGDELLIMSGKAKILLKKGGEVLIEGTDISVKASGNLTLKAKKILEN